MYYCFRCLRIAFCSPRHLAYRADLVPMAWPPRNRTNFLSKVRIGHPCVWEEDNLCREARHLGAGSGMDRRFGTRQLGIWTPATNLKCD